MDDYTVRIVIEKSFSFRDTAQDWARGLIAGAAASNADRVELDVERNEEA